ncbi:MAG TPA: CDP-alcohol phosphatidyltransferase family protein [Phycisphaerae bacterium]|nr:CDP-alcohol phosphatidyltransferase family protein [Phycisphaerae bacterium]
MRKTARLGWPNKITIGRLILIGPFAVCLLHLDEPDSNRLRWAAVTIFAVMAISDALDGQLARYLGAVTNLGRFLDAAADYMMTTAALPILCVIGVRGLADSGADPVLSLPWWAATIAIGKDVLVTAGVSSIYLSTRRFFSVARPLGKACRDVQFALVLSMLLWPSLPHWLAGLPKLLWYLATILALGATLDYIRLGTRYAATAAAEKPGSAG